MKMNSGSYSASELSTQQDSNSYEQLSEFQSGRINGLKEAGSANRRIARHMCRSNAAIRRYWQERVNNSRFQRLDGSGRPRATADRERQTYSTAVRRRHSENCFATVPLVVLWSYFQQDNVRPRTARVAMNCLKACQTLPWPDSLTDLSLIEHVWDMIRRRLHLPWNVDDLPRKLVQIWQEIHQKTIRVIYHSMPLRVAACIQAKK
ncbi:transposable element Tcb1 transposase [Trichonephila clavipes]|nr:transposable element Tcb1 transposase [Trichonephila clavipes]